MDRKNMPSIIISVSLDKETMKIWEKIPREKRSITVREWLRKLDPTTKKEPESNAEQIKKLLTLEPSQEQPPKSGDSRGPTTHLYVSENIMTKEKLQHSRYMTQPNENRHSLLYNLPSGSLCA